MIRQIHLLRLVASLAFAGIFIATAFQASAADVASRSPMPMPVTSPVPVQNWAGFYAGIHGGFMGSGFKSSASTPNSPALSFSGQKTTTSLSAGMLGVQAGYNFQSGSLVYGVEGEASFSPSHGKTSTTHLTVDQKGRYALKGRLGYSFGSTLVFATTGLAFTQSSVRSPATGSFKSARRDLTESGLLIGVGVEQKMSEALSVKGEVDYAGFGQHRLTFPAGTTKVQSGIFTAKVGLNYRF